jgi:predicted transcriptional regulator
MATREEAIKKARAIKTKRVQNNIQSAINILTLYGAKITVRSVAKESGVSTSTIQKYLKTMKPKEEIKTDQVEITPKKEKFEGYPPDLPNYFPELKKQIRETIKKKFG